MEVTVLGQCSSAPVILEIPLFLSRVEAGFPSPAEDYIEKALDLNELCIRTPAATFFVRADGYSMVNSGIFPGDILVVDRSLKPHHKDIVVAAVDGAFTVKHLLLHPKIALQPANFDYKTIEFKDGNELEIFGVVTYVIHGVARK